MAPGYVSYLHPTRSCAGPLTSPLCCPIGLAVQYRSRRDFLIDTLHDEFHMRASVGTTGSWTGCTVYTASAKPKGRSGDVMSEKFGGFGAAPKFPTPAHLMHLLRLTSYSPEVREVVGEEEQIGSWDELRQIGRSAVVVRLALSLQYLQLASSHHSPPVSCPMPKLRRPRR